MRFTTLLALSAFLIAPAAFAQETPAAPKAPAAASATAEKSQPTTTVPGPANPAKLVNEPNLKVTKDSGGKSTSYMIKDAPLRSDFVMGKSSAPVLIVEYASMSCPHCAHFSNTVLPEIEKKYIETGQVRYILRQFPLNEPALKAAMLLQCVGDQDSKRYYTFSRVLFDAQPKWAFDGNYLSGLETMAAVGGVTKEQFFNCVNNTDREMQVLAAKKKANEEVKIPHTPYIFIAGEAYEGDRSVEAVSKFIDAKLAEISQKKGVVDQVLDRL